MDAKFEDLAHEPCHEPCAPIILNSLKSKLTLKNIRFVMLS
jgi:hypothetical protein